MVRVPPSERQKRKSWPRAIRELFNGARCVVCGSDYRICIDHKVQLSRGGTNDLENLQALCEPCNCHKGFFRTDEEMHAWYAANKEEIDRDRRRRERNRYTNTYDWT